MAAGEVPARPGRYAIDPEVAAGLVQHARPAQAVARGDWRALAPVVTLGMKDLAELEGPVPESVQTTDATATSADGAPVRVRWYAPHGEGPGSAVVFVHGGGMIAGDIDLYDGLVGRLVQESGVPFLSVEYRLAPGVSATTPAADGVAALSWLHDHAGVLGVDRARAAVMGESAGGAIAAAMAIEARDTGRPLARQILIYPMLDDRTVESDGTRDGLLTWDHDAGYTAWTALLGADRGTDAVSPLAAPARLTDHAGLAPAYIEVGDLDIFRDEDIAYALALARAGVPLELHVHPGAPHGFERYAPESALAQRAQADRLRVIRSL